MTQKTAAGPTSFGPVQLTEFLGVGRWWLERAQGLGLVDGPDRAGGRWSRAYAEQVRERLEDLRPKVGAVPDVGVFRAAEILGKRLGIEVSPDAVRELARTEVVPEVGDYKGHALFCGRALESLSEREDAAAVLARAEQGGRLMIAGEAAAYLRIRRCDFQHLQRAGWVEPVGWGRGPFQPRRYGGNVPIYRARDLDVLAEHPGIDWEAVRATPKGRPSPLATLTTRKAAR